MKWWHFYLTFLTLSVKFMGVNNKPRTPREETCYWSAYISALYHVTTVNEWTA